MKVKLLSRVRLFVTPWTAAYQAPPSMGFSRQEYWSGVPLSSPFHLITVFILKSILSDISIAIPAFFGFSYVWKSFSHPFTFNLCVSRSEVSLL